MIMKCIFSVFSPIVRDNFPQIRINMAKKTGRAEGKFKAAAEMLAFVCVFIFQSFER